MDAWTEMNWTPTAEELEAERQFWAFMQMRDEVAAYEAAQAELEWEFESWPLEDLEYELETVRTLTPDEAAVIEELEQEIARRTRAVA